MSNTIGGSGSNFERLVRPEISMKTRTTEFLNIPQGIPASVHNTKDLRQAEIRGQNFSIGEEELIKAIERANKAMQGINTSFEFSIHEGTKEIMVKVLDKDTGEVVREIPSEKILDMVARMWEMSGILIDERR